MDNRKEKNWREIYCHWKQSVWLINNGRLMWSGHAGRSNDAGWEKH